MNDNVFINAVNNHHDTVEKRHEAFLAKYRYTPKTSNAKHYTGTTKQRIRATQKSKTSQLKMTISGMLAAGLIVLGSATLSENGYFKNNNVYLPTQNSVVKQIEYAMSNPDENQLDDIFSYRQAEEFENWKVFENNIIQYSKLKSEKNLTSEQKEDLKKYAKDIQDYYNHNTGIANSTMLSYVKVAIADKYTKTHDVTLSNGIKVPDKMSYRDITFSNVSDNNFKAGKIGSYRMDFKDAPEIYDAVHSIVLLQSGNTDVRQIVDCYSKCAKVLDTRLSIEEKNQSYVISSQRNLSHDDWAR